jgi:hypothetical protein
VNVTPANIILNFTAPLFMFVVLKGIFNNRHHIYFPYIKILAANVLPKKVDSYTDENYKFVTRNRGLESLSQRISYGTQ